MNNKTQNILKNVSLAVLDTILPPRCVITGEMVDKQGMIAPQAWAGIDFIGGPICYKCGVPFGFEVGGFEGEGGAHCTQCLDYPPPYETARAAIKYNDESKSLILSFKNGDQTHAALAFVPWLKMAGAQMLQDADVLIPVPLHRWRLLRRRYNQSAIMAQYLGKERGIPVLHQGLVRIRPTPTQGHLSYVERKKNVKRAFAVHPKYQTDINGKTLILIDDVYTTGSTVKECTKVLIKAGAKAVHVLTLARVARFES